MSEISIYDIVPTPKLADKLIGTSVGGTIPDVTYNFTLEELLQLFIPNIPANTLQGVLDYGNTATQDINLTGTINTTDLNVLATANILDSVLTGETHIEGELFDRLDSKGTAGQVLTSTGSGVEWYTIPTVIPTLQQVLQSGNTSNISIVLTANITAVTATASNVVSNTSLSVNGTLKDGTASAGSTDQILSSTGSGVEWVDMPVYNAVSPLLYNSITKTFSIQVANSSQGGYLSSADWINFDGKQDAIILTTSGTSGAATFVGNTLNIPVYTPDLSGYVPTSRTLTINGVTYDLSANRSWTIPAGVADVTATSPLFSSGGAYPDISIQVANSGQNGYLSAADWSTFNNKQSALTFSSPLVNTAGVVSIPAATTSVSGYLTNTDWNTFNNKQNALDGGTGLVKSTAGTITYITDNSTNWNTAYNRSIVSAAVTGTTTKTLTLNEQDGNTITASWTDLDTGLTSVGLSMPSAFTVTNSPLTSNGTIGVTGAGSASQYVRGDGTLATFPTVIAEAQNLITEVYNRTGATLTKGTVVYINGGQGNLPTVTKAIATGDSTSAQTYGVIQTDITNMNNGYVVVAGRLQDIDTQAYSDGTQLYLSSTTAGTWTSTKQYAPAHLVYVGIVVRSHPTQGIVEVKIQNGYEMDELHNVSAQTPSNGNILQYVSSTQLWTSVAGTTTNIAEGTNLYYLDSRARAALSFTAGSGAYNSTTGVITIPTNTNQLTNGASFITLSSLTASSPLSYNNTTGDFSISQSGASANGYLSSTDWNTFNNKQASGDYITSLTGEATGTGPGATAVTLNNASVTGKVLTGVNITGGSVVATDTMLTAFGKLQNQINGLIGSTIYQGVWNASTNTPTLASSVGTRGYYYIVNVAGNTNLNGITDWQVGDWAIYDGSAWQKVDNTDAVTSVNGFTGAVSLTTDNIAQGTTNLYFANSLARTAVSLTTTGSSGAATYNNTTGIFNIPNYGTALANYLPLTGGTLTGALIIDPANTGVVGLDVASNTVTLRSDSTNPFARQLTTTMGSGTLIKVQAAGFGGTYVTDLGFYTSSSSAVNTTPNLYLTGGNNRVGINTITPAQTLDVVGTAGVSGVLTLGSTISNGTYTYTLPGATGTLALVGGAGVGTVTSVAALTIGTTGTDLSSSVANSTTTPVITLNVPTASGTNRGALSSADWTTFNGKQNTITLTTTGTSGASTFDGSTLNIPQYQAAITNAITGTLTATKIPKATGANTIGDSIITDSGTYITVSAAAVDNYIASFINTDAGSSGIYVKADGAAFVCEPLSMVGGITLNASGSASFSGDINANKFIKSGGTSSQFLMADGSTSTGPAGGITGSLTTGYIPRATGTTTLGNSIIQDSTTSITVNGTGTIGNDSTNGDLTIISNATPLIIRGRTPYNRAFMAFSWDISPDAGVMIGNVLKFNTNATIGTNTGSTALTLATTGAATFSNSILANGAISTSGDLFIRTTGALVFNSAANFNTQIYHDSGGIVLYTSALPRLSVLANGNVIINNNITDAGYKLDVNGTGRFVSANNTTALSVTVGGNAFYQFKGNSTSGYTTTFNINDTALYIGHDSASRSLILQTNSTDRLTIAGSGAATFSSSVTTGGDVSLPDGNSLRIGGQLIANRTGNEIRFGSGTAADYLVYYAGAAERMRITSAGNFDYGGFNVQSSNNSVYRQAFWGPMSIMWRNAEDFYINSNHTYSSSNTNVATYTSSNGIGRLGIAGGDFSWSTYNGSVSAGSAYTLTERFNIAPSGAARFSSSVTATQNIIAANNGNSSDYNYLIFNNTASGYGDWNIYKTGSNDLGLGYGTDAGSSYSPSITFKYGGNVVIGATTDNGNRLQVIGTGAYFKGTSVYNTLQIDNSSTSGGGGMYFLQNGTIYGGIGVSGWYLGGTSNNLYIVSEPNKDILFATNGGSERTRITSTGDILFSGATTGASIACFRNNSSSLTFFAGDSGSSTKEFQWHVTNGSTQFMAMQLRTTGYLYLPKARIIGDTDIAYMDLYNNNLGNIRIVNTSSSNPYGRIELYTNNTLRVTIATDGNATFTQSVTATSFFESSDKTIKTLIEDNYQAKGIESVIAKLYIKDGKQELGYFAQDVQGILPSAVSKGEDGLLSLSYREVLVAKVQRTETEIDKLKRRVAELEQQLNLN